MEGKIVHLGNRFAGTTFGKRIVKILETLSGQTGSSAPDSSLRVSCFKATWSREVGKKATLAMKLAWIGSIAS